MTRRCKLLTLAAEEGCKTMKEKIKHILLGIVFGAFAIYVAFNMGDWRVVFFEIIEIPYTGWIVAIVSALASIGAFMTAFEKK